MHGTQIDHDEEVRQLAYKIWQEAGCPIGSDLQHWLKAQEIWQEAHPQGQSPTSQSKARKPRKARANKTAL